MKALKLTVDEWLTIQQEIKKRHPNSVLLTRWKMRDVLGFTTRDHQEWITFDHTGPNNLTPRKYLKQEVHLDFYDEAKRTMFLLKYGDHIDANS